MANIPNISKASSIEIKLFSPSDLASSPAWALLHSIILEAYKPTRKDWPLPEAFQRLHLDPKDAGAQLVKELGPDAKIAVAFNEANPVGCAAVQRFKIIRQSDVDGTSTRGPHGPHSASADADVDTKSTANIANSWEITLVTTALQYRGQRIAQQLIQNLTEYVKKEYEANHSMVRTVDAISGDYWRKLGFKTVEEWCIVLPRGFSHIANAPQELRMERDVRLWTGRKDIQ